MSDLERVIRSITEDAERYLNHSFCGDTDDEALFAARRALELVIDLANAVRANALTQPAEPSKEAGK